MPFDNPLTPKQIKDLELSRKHQELQQKVEAHPIMQATKNAFEGEIKNIKEIKP